jgi:hypothetical protein
MNTEKEEIALNPNTSVETLTKLSADEGEGVRSEVAHNPNTPVETLTKLSADEGEGYQLLLKFLRL